jgi:hypothetical protein
VSGLHTLFGERTRSSFAKGGILSCDEYNVLAERNVTASWNYYRATKLMRLAGHNVSLSLRAAKDVCAHPPSRSAGELRMHCGGIKPSTRALVNILFSCCQCSAAPRKKSCNPIVRIHPDMSNSSSYLRAYVR